MKNETISLLTQAQCELSWTRHNIDLILDRIADIYQDEYRRASDEEDETGVFRMTEELNERQQAIDTLLDSYRALKSDMDKITKIIGKNY